MPSRALMHILSPVTRKKPNKLVTGTLVLTSEALFFQKSNGKLYTRLLDFNIRMGLRVTMITP